MAVFKGNLELGTVKAALILFVVLSLIITGVGYMFMKNREDDKLTGMDRYMKVYRIIAKRKNVLLEHLQEARLNMLEYLLTRNEINRYQALYAINEVMPSFNAFKDVVPEGLKSKDLGKDLSEIQFILDSLDKSMISVLSVDGKLPGIGVYDPEDSLALTGNAYEFDGHNGTPLESAGLDRQFDRLKRSMLNFEIGLDKAINAHVSGIFATGNLDILLGFIISMGMIFTLFIFLLQRNIRSSILQSGRALEKISKGEIPDKVEEKDDEFKLIHTSSNKLIDYLKEASEFAVQIGKGNFRRAFETKSEHDLLGNALLEMSNRLSEVAEEDKVRNWMNEGRAKFANILRQYGNNIQELGDHLISGLVDYVGAVQGGLFVVGEEEDQSYLELLSAFAYGRKKYEKRKIQPGEGLAGQVFIERKEVYIKDIKEDHFYIQTGMGASRPASALIVPLMDENNIEGVLELAFLNELNEHQIAFVKQVAENIASSLRSSKINHKTRLLLDETRQKAEEMAAQEEELRQNMEELAATQEQMERLRADEEKMRKELEGRQKLLTDILNKIPEQVFIKDQSGKLILLNQTMADVCGKKVEDLIGTTGFESYPPEEAERLNNEEIGIIESGKIYDNPEEEVKDPQGNKKVFWTRKIPFYISYLDQKGLLCIRTDITEIRHLKEELTKKEKSLSEVEKKLREGLE